MKNLTITACMLLYLPVSAAFAGTVEGEISKAVELLNSKEKERGVQGLRTIISKLEQELKKSPSDASRYYQLGRAHFYLQDDNAALKAFDKSLKISPEVAPVHFMKGLVLRYLKKEAESLASLRKAAELRPKSGEYRYELGQTLEYQGKNKGALVEFQKAVELTPQNIKALTAAGTLMIKLKRVEEALAYFLKIIKVDPKQGLAHYNAGQAYQLLGKPKEAAACYQETVRLKPDDWRTQAKLVQCFEALGNLKQRDACRATLFEMKQKGKIKEDFYCRDQFVASEKHVMVFEYFKLQGERALKYNFYILAKDRSRTLFRISLGSYDSTNAIAHEMGSVPKGKRQYHLDGYFPNEHQTYGFFVGAPPYKKIKELVSEILAKKRNAISSTQYGNKKAKPKAP